MSDIIPINYKPSFDCHNCLSIIDCIECNHCISSINDKYCFNNNQCAHCIECYSCSFCQYCEYSYHCKNCIDSYYILYAKNIKYDSRPFRKYLLEHLELLEKNTINKILNYIISHFELSKHSVINHVDFFIKYIDFINISSNKIDRLDLYVVFILFPRIKNILIKNYNIPQHLLTFIHIN